MHLVTLQYDLSYVYVASSYLIFFLDSCKILFMFAALSGGFGGLYWSGTGTVRTPEEERKDKRTSRTKDNLYDSQLQGLDLMSAFSLGAMHK